VRWRLGIAVPSWIGEPYTRVSAALAHRTAADTSGLGMNQRQRRVDAIVLADVDISLQWYQMPWYFGRGE
jgi:hypothetical protein